ncbi:AraC family transcriptional regulator [Pontibacter sp. Tf4]|uniref:AraC family transcriptional regulator n=1 Tax=Pontibacter sp. Tf4 TaxID=2761620 RepID=UPI001626841B|nr:helix-turn-helix domain-containing protein [Pontibacter sp. Tf4]MBB6610111.1 AraC family transcriptional regulator [Pontibacter sp. Tf4]
MITEQEIAIHTNTGTDFLQPYKTAFYQILLFKGKGTFIVDFTEYTFSGNTILFLTPYQCLQWKSGEEASIYRLSFHGDFYCIEYHKKEVACNGLLFNNIYLAPHLSISGTLYNEIADLFRKIETEKSAGNAFSEAILKAYLQLILALCSKEKSIHLKTTQPETIALQDQFQFQELLDKHFIQERSPAFYAAKARLSTNAFGKYIRKQYGKTPTQLIQERVILEAKKLLHLTHKSVKEIAAELHFEDEFYFSRYFKKSVGLSPLHYRDEVGISIVAK